MIRFEKLSIKPMFETLIRENDGVELMQWKKFETFYPEIAKNFEETLQKEYDEGILSYIVDTSEYRFEIEDYQGEMSIYAFVENDNNKPYAYYRNNTWEIEFPQD